MNTLTYFWIGQLIFDIGVFIFILAQWWIDNDFMDLHKLQSDIDNRQGNLIKDIIDILDKIRPKGNHEE